MFWPICFSWYFKSCHLFSLLAGADSSRSSWWMSIDPLKIYDFRGINNDLRVIARLSWGPRWLGSGTDWLCPSGVCLGWKFSGSNEVGGFWRALTFLCCNLQYLFSPLIDRNNAPQMKPCKATIENYEEESRSTKWGKAQEKLTASR